MPDRFELCGAAKIDVRLRWLFPAGCQQQYAFTALDQRDADRAGANDADVVRSRCGKGIQSLQRGDPRSSAVWNAPPVLTVDGSG